MTEKPKKAAKKATSSPREAEAGDGHVTVEQCGVTLRVPLKGKIPLAAIERFYEGDNFGGTKVILGEKQWKQLLDAGATDGDLEELGKKLEEATGN